MERKFDHSLKTPAECVGVTAAEYDKFSEFVERRVADHGSKSKLTEELYIICHDKEHGDDAIRLFALHYAQLIDLLHIFTRHLRIR